MDEELIDRPKSNRKRRETQASPMPSERPSKRQCVLKAAAIDFMNDNNLDPSDEEPLASQRLRASMKVPMANELSFTDLHANSDTSTLPIQPQSRTSKIPLQSPDLLTRDVAKNALLDSRPREISTPSSIQNNPTLKHNVIFDIRSMTVGSHEWQNPTSAKLEFCVAQRMFVPFDGHPPDSAMNPYRTYVEFQVRPTDISGLRIRSAVMKDDMVSMQKVRWGNSWIQEATVVNVAFRNPDDALVVAALVLLYNRKVEMTTSAL